MVQLENKKIAFITSPQMGDSLISMVTVNNLQCNNHDVTVFSNYIYALRDWFPSNKIQATPELGEAKRILAAFDVLIYTYPQDIIDAADKWHPCVIILANSSLYKLRISMVDIQVAVCKDELGLNNLVRTNELVAPANLIFKKYPYRVIIHPTSKQAFRSWPAKKYVQLAHLLQQQGYDPYFVVSPTEAKDWQWLNNEKLKLLNSDSLATTAQWIYESSFFIGNDSGIGHLASNLGLPTISLIPRPSLAKQWRPSWAPGVIVLPPKWLITCPLKEKYWPNFVSVSKVYKTVKKFMIKPLAGNPNFIYHKTFHKRFICTRNYYTDSFKKLIANPDSFLNNSNHYLKNDPGDTTTVGVVNIDDRQLVIKRYNIKSFAYLLKHCCFRRSRALRSWLNAHRLLALNIPTPQPTAIIENRCGLFTGKAYFISEYIDGIRGCQYFEPHSKFAAKWPIIIANMTSIIKDLAKHHITHGDLRHVNMIVAGEQVFMLDLDHVRQYRSENWLYRRKRKRDLRNFMNNLNNNPIAKTMFQGSLVMNHICVD